MSNYSWVFGLPEIENGHSFVDDTFVQIEPHTSIFEGKTGLTFENCNLTNCDLPPDAIKVKSINRHISFCSHLRPEWVAKGLPECIESCSHVTEVDTITIDGQIVDTVYHRKDTTL